MSEKKAARFLRQHGGEDGMACISIIGIEDEEVSRWIYPHNTLFLRFDDVDKETTTEFPMDDSQAREIAGFVKSMKDEIKTLVVHCVAGYSRSAGVAAAILKYLYGTDEQVFGSPMYRPNMCCYRKTLEALMDDSTGPMPEEFARTLLKAYIDSSDFNIKNFEIGEVKQNAKLPSKHFMSFSCRYVWRLNAWDKNAQGEFGIIKKYKNDEYSAIVYGGTVYSVLGTPDNELIKGVMGTV